MRATCLALLLVLVLPVVMAEVVCKTDDGWAACWYPYLSTCTGNNISAVACADLDPPAIMEPFLREVATWIADFQSANPRRMLARIVERRADPPTLVVRCHRNKTAPPMPDLGIPVGPLRAGMLRTDRFRCYDVRHYTVLGVRQFDYEPLSKDEVVLDTVTVWLDVQSLVGPEFPQACV